MSEMPLISIIITAYNSERFLPATLESVRAQTLRDWECLVVDDGSTDHTPAIVSSHGSQDHRIRLIRQPNAGLPAARNRAYEGVSPHSKYVIFLDSDDIWLPEALEKLELTLRNSPETVGAHGLAELIDAEGQRIHPGKYAEHGRNRLGFDGKNIVPWELDKPTTFDVLIVTGKITPPGMLLLKKEVLDKAGRFDLIKSQEDYDLWIRVSRYGAIAFLNEVVILYRRHDQNMTNNTRLQHRMVAYVKHKTFFSEENDSRQKFIVKRAYRANELYKIGEKLASSRECLRDKNYRECFKLYARACGNLLRFFRGYPTRNG